MANRYWVGGSGSWVTSNVVDSFAGGGAAFALSSTANQKGGQSFTGSGLTINGSSFSLFKFGAPVGDVTAEIWSHNGTFGSTGVPSTLLATSNPVAAASLSSSVTTINFTFNTPITTVNNTRYFATVAFSGGDGSNYVGLLVASAASSTHPGNAALRNGASWAAQGTVDIPFTVYSTQGANWSTSSGGAPGASIPTASDAVIFDNNSFSASNLTVTLDTASVVPVYSIDFSQLTMPQNFNTNNKQFHVYGNKIAFNALVNYSNTGAGIKLLTGAGVTTMTIDYGGSNVFSRLEFVPSVTGVIYELLNDLGTPTVPISSFDGSSVAASVFTLRTNSKRIFCNEIYIDDKHTVDFGSSLLDVARDIDLAYHDTGANNLIADKARLQMRSTNFHPFYINVNQSFGDVEVVPGATVSIYGGTVRSLVIGDGAQVSMSSNSTLVVTTSFVAFGTSANRAQLFANVVGTVRSLDLAQTDNVSVRFASIKDISVVRATAVDAYESLDRGNNSGWNFTSVVPSTMTDVMDSLPAVTVTPPRDRQLFFKIEKLNSSEAVLEERSVVLTDGNVEVGSGGFRRKCSFELLGGLPTDYQQYRWRLHYGYRNQTADDVTYYPLGVFIPVNPDEREANDGLVTSFQGVDKIKLFADYQLDAPVKFTSGTTVRSIVQTVAGWFGETKLLLASDIGTLAADFTFEEGSTAEQLLDALITSFSAEWFYDPDGYLVARKRVAAALRPVRFVMDDVDDPQYLSSRRSIDETNYYNKLTLVGGKIDTPIYRTTLSDTAAIARAGGRVVQRYFTRDAAVTQSQVDGLAAFYLSNGVLLPSTLRLTSLVIPNLEVDDIISKSGVRYEVRSFNVPLGLGAQTITAGEIVA